MPKTTKSAPARRISNLLPVSIMHASLIKGTPKGYKVSKEYFTKQDIMTVNIPAMKTRQVVVTPAGSIYPDRSSIYLFAGGRAMIENELLGKTFSMDFLLVDGERRPVLQEDPNGPLRVVYVPEKRCEICNKVLQSEKYIIPLKGLTDEMKAELMDLLKNDFRPADSARFAIKKVIHKDSNDLWLAFEKMVATAL